MSLLGALGAAAKVGFGLHHLASAGEILYSYLPGTSSLQLQCRRTFQTMTKEIKTIGTHDGVFHCDEVLGCAMLKLMFPAATIVRSRKDDVLAKCDIVIDVGGVYDPDTLRFDHHQKGFEVTAASLLPGKPWTIKLSSAGLVYCHFGKDVLRCVVDIEDDQALEKVFDRVYENFVREVDGIDNGVPMCCENMKYTISTNLSARVGNMNKAWNQTDFDETKAFEKAMSMVCEEFKDRVEYYTKQWLPARAIVQSAIEKRFEIDESGEIIELKEFCPWKGHYFDLEKELNLQPTVKFAIFDSKDSWRVNAVPIDEKSFILRLPLLKEWQGLREENIDVDGAIFVHGSGFIGGNRTRDGALEMARRTLAARSPKRPLEDS